VVGNYNRHRGRERSEQLDEEEPDANASGFVEFGAKIADQIVRREAHNPPPHVVFFSPVPPTYGSGTGTATWSGAVPVGLPDS
jgi:hypothetical protein